MATWLVKADPETYGLDDLERERRTRWDGVKNAVAVRNMLAVKKGDEVLVYHTGDEKSVVGVARAASGGAADPKDPKLAVFELQFVRRLLMPVPLAAIKADPVFADFALVRVPRLSVLPVPAALATRLRQMAGEKS